METMEMMEMMEMIIVHQMIQKFRVVNAVKVNPMISLTLWIFPQIYQKMLIFLSLCLLLNLKEIKEVVPLGQLFIT